VKSLHIVQDNYLAVLRIAIGMTSELIPAQKDVRVAPNFGDV
jgi:hypothetical protein